jgi:hypothetical protein
VFNVFIDDIFKTSNFIGGINDKKRTLHENMFARMYPHLKSQVHFGTGKGGYKEYGVKRYTVDFYDEHNRIIYEIDGKNHNLKLNKLKDRIRELFFGLELGITTVRFTNEQVEQMLFDRLVNLREKGVLK